jgi:hypothetical protein
LETAAELRGYISDLPAALRISFRCATEDPNHLQGEFLSYERGSMLYLYEPGKMLVSYVGVYNGVASPWEDFNVAWRAADPAGEPTPPVAPEELRFYPARMFATIWQTGVVRERLGMATTPQPEPISVVMQRFNQGLLVLRLPLSEQERATLYIYPLAARIF